MKKYKFFYDESEHSRKITKNTVNAVNFSTNFVAGVIGYIREDEKDILSDYLSFEKKYKNIFSVSELKSTIIKPSQIQYGFSSLNTYSIKLLQEYMDFFIKNKLHCYFSVINKIEYIIIQLFMLYKNSIFVDMDTLRYSISKMIDVYRPKPVIDAIYRNDGTLVIELVNFMKSQLKRNRNLPHKEDENNIIKQLLQILNDYNRNFIIDWNYMIAFDGFKKYLEEKKIYSYELVIDQEGTKNTILSANYVGLSNVYEKNSQISTGIRISDFFVGLISKFIKALDNDLHYSTEEEMMKKKYLSEQWFCISETHFQMYKQWQNIIVNQHKAFFKTYTGNYSDIFISFICLLNYISGFQNISEFQKIDVKTHQNDFNEMVVRVIYKKGEEIHKKLPFEELLDTQDDFYITKKGVKVYKDYSKHKFLFIPTDSKSLGIIYNVLSIGFLGAEEQPCVTIQEEGKPVLYLIPNDYLDWAIICVGFAMSGDNIFPTRVKFLKKSNKYYAEIIEK